MVDRDRRIVRRRCAWTVAAALLVAACGGGGSSGAPSAPSASLANIRVPTLPSYTYEMVTANSRSIPSFAVQADVVGDLQSLNGRTIFVIVEDPDGLVQSASLQQPLQTTATLSVETKQPGPKKGRYVNRLRIRVCFDASCSQEMAGSPISIPYDITVLQGFIVGDGQPIVIRSSASSSVSTVLDLPVTLPDGLRFASVLGRYEIDGLVQNLGNGVKTAPQGNPPTSLRLTTETFSVGSWGSGLVLYAQAETPSGIVYRLEFQVPVTHVVSP